MQENIESRISAILLKHKQTLCTAESCTGGYIAHLITSRAGSSAYFKGGIVAYSNEVKTKILNVQKSDLQKYGAVSKQVVEQMALHAKQKLHTDYAIATSGIAGPGGGSPSKPVGTVWLAVAGSFGVKSQKLQLGKLREENIKTTSLKSLQLLYQIIKLNSVEAQS